MKVLIDIDKQIYIRAKLREIEGGVVILTDY